MRKNLFILIPVVLLFLSSCGKGGDAVRYNDKIIGIQAKVINKMLILSQSFQTGNADLMQRRLEELQDQTTESANELSNLEEFNGGDDLFNAAMDLLEFYESICTHEFQEMVDIISRSGTGITPADRERLMDLQRYIQEEEGELDRQLAEAQQNFAKKFGFRIGKNKIQKKIDNM